MPLPSRSEREALAARIADNRRQRADLYSEANKLVSQPTMTDGERTRFENLQTGMDNLERRIIDDEETLERMRAEIDARLSLATAVTGDGAAGVGEHFQVLRGRNVAEAFSRADSLGGENSAAGSRVLVDAARSAIDNWTNIRSAVPTEYQERAERLLANADPRQQGAIARHIAALSTADYSDAFADYLTSGPTFMSSDSRRVMRSAEEALYRDRAANEGSIGAGQALVPPMLDPTIILTNVGTLNPFRQIADVRQIATQTWHGVSSHGVTAEWTAEAAEATDATPGDFLQPTITPVRADAYVQVSYELAQDTTIVTELAELMADAKDRLEGTAFAVGTGSTQPLGIVTALNLTTASRLSSTTNGQLGAVDIFALDSALPARYRKNASWVASPGVWNLVRQMGQSPSPYSSTFWVDFAGDLPSKLLGKQVYESSDMVNTLSTATASNDDVVIIGDFRNFKIIDRIGMSIGRIDVIGTTRRPTGEFGFFSFWRTGSGCINADAFRMAVV